jgi:UPF0755 protein
MAKKKKKPMSKWRRYLVAVAAVVAFFLIAISINFYIKIYAPSVRFADDDHYLYVPTGTGFNQLLTIISDKKIVHSIEAFHWVALQMKLQDNIHAGRYRLEQGMSNYDLVKLLRSGRQEPVKLVINKFRLEEDFAGFISHKLEADSITLITYLNDNEYLQRVGFNTQNSMALFIPNTYEFYWNTSASEFFDRMKKEYDHFWNEERKNKAIKLGLSPVEVITLASIVEEETNYNQEKSRIAGVYLNRIKNNMLLQADPTVKFALKDFTLTRVLNIHTAYSSPYNTYINKGLPPGPICNPSIITIDAVLNAEQNEYLYFCANPDKPGSHVFAKTYQEHQLNARRYQKWLMQRGV